MRVSRVEGLGLGRWIGERSNTHDTLRGWRCTTVRDEQPTGMLREFTSTSSLCEFTRTSSHAHTYNSSSYASHTISIFDALCTGEPMGDRIEKHVNSITKCERFSKRYPFDSKPRPAEQKTDLGTIQQPILKCCSANVLTLSPSTLVPSGPEQAGLFLTARSEILESSFHIRKYDTVGLQECRISDSFRKYGHHYMIVSSSADSNRCLGVQLWLAKHLKVQTKAVRPVSPRVLLVAVYLHKRYFIFVVGHIPDATHSAEVEGVWNDITSNYYRLAKMFNEHSLICFPDANGRVGSQPSKYMGPCNKAAEDDTGFALHLRLHELELYASNTFFPVGHTWMGATGKTHRIDYVLLDHDMYESICNVLIDHDIDLSTAERDDHAVVAVTLKLSKAPRVIEPRRPPGAVKIDMDKLQDPYLVEQLCRHVSSMSIEESASIDTHAAKLQSHLFEATQWFSAAPTTPIKSWLRNDTWEAITQVSYLKKYLPKTKHHSNVITMSMYFIAWLSIRPFTFLRCHLDFRLP